jgi:hypothetical protein
MKSFITLCFILLNQLVFASGKTGNMNWSGSGFTENKGQLLDEYGKPASDIKYIYDNNNGFRIVLNSFGFSYQVYHKQQNSNFSEAGPVIQESLKNVPESNIQIHKIDILFAGANVRPIIFQENILPGYFNYYNQEVPVLNVHSYGRITYKNFYPKIDLVFYIKDAQPEYDFVLHPGADINDIQLMYKGMDDMNVDSNGVLNMANSFGTITESITKSYQQEDHKNVHVCYELNQSTIRFKAGNYNKNQTLVIDPVPVLIWGRYFAGANGDWGNNVVVDSKNNNVMVGTTFSAAVSTGGAHQTVLKGGQDAFLARFNAKGVLLWATYYGGSGTEQGNNIALDANDNIVICGFTYSNSGIATAGAYNTKINYNNTTGASDAFLSKFDSTGVLLWGSYYGGEGNDQAWGLTLDLTGNIVMVGYTESFNDIATVGAYQTVSNIPGNRAYPIGFLVKFNAAGNVRQWGSYYGAGATFGTCCADVAVDKGNRILIMGCTDSPSFISGGAVHQLTYGGGASDAFVASFNPTGTRIWGTYFGGNGNENSFPGVNGNPYLFPDFFIDSNDNIIITGSTTSVTGIASAGAFQQAYGGAVDAFITKLDSTGNLVWGTYYGGSGQDFGESVFIDKSNTIYVVGATASNNNIGTPCAHQDSLNGQLNTFITSFSTLGAKLWGTYEATVGTPITSPNGGGPSGDGIAVNSLNQVIVTGATNAGSIASNMLSAPFYGTVNGASAFLTMFEAKSPSVPHITGPTTICLGVAPPILNVGPNKSYVWKDLTTSKTVATTQTYSPTQAGTYQVSVASDSFSCVLTSTPFQLKDALAYITVANAGNVCMGDSVLLTSSKGLSYQWGTGQVTQSIYEKNTGTYNVLVKDTSGCVSNIKTAIKVVTPPTVSIEKDTVLCPGASQTIQLPTISGTSYAWSDGSVKSSYVIKKAGIYSVAITTFPCKVQHDTITVRAPHIPIITGPKRYCPGSMPILTSSLAKAYSWTNLNNSQTISTTKTFSPSQPGTYEVSVIADSSSCRLVSAPFQLSEITPVVTSNNNNKICSAGGTSTLTSSIGLNYKWSTGETTQTISVTAPGIYSVTVKDTSGCVSSGQDNITGVTPPTISIVKDTVLCPGTSQTIQLPAISGTSYAWSDGSVKSSFVITKAGIYSVAITTFPCKVQYDSITVRAPQVPVITGPKRYCPGSTPILTSSLAKSYSWTNLNNSQTISTTKTLAPSQPGNYEVRVIADSSSCVLVSAPFQLDEISPVITSSNNNKICLGGTSTLKSSIGLNYKWSTGETTQTISVTAPGIYSVTVKDTSGCVSSGQDNIKGVKPPVFSLGNDTTLCNGMNKTIALNIPNATYLWSDGSVQSSYTISTPGTYWVTVNESPCTAVRDSVIITYIDEIKYTVPNLITYNHDGMNDSFVVLNIIPNTHVEIYNRWGSCVFKSENYENNWYPEDVSDGVYYCHVSNSNSCVKDYKQWLEVIR